MKILSAIISNYKAIHRVEITPKGNITVISGNNSQGKSSAIDALITTLAGEERGSKSPVRRGENNAIIEIDLGDRIIKRNITGDRDELTVYTKDGFVVKQPRTSLNELLDKRKFNVMTFITGTPKEQRALLLELAGVSFEELDSKRGTVYDDRTLIGRERDSLKGQLDGLPFTVDVPKVLIDTQELLNQIKANNDFNNNIKSGLLTLQSSKEKKQMLEMEIHQTEEKLKMLKAQLAPVVASIESMEVASKDLAPKDNTELEAKLNGAEVVNNKIRQNEKRDEVLAQFNAKQTNYDAKTEELKQIEQDKLDTLKNAKFPIPGLSVSDEGVLFNNLPIEQESRSNRLKIALSIAVAIPTELRTIILDDAEVLDDENMKIVDEIMVKHDYQAIIARRQDPDENTYTIKEGNLI